MAHALAHRASRARVLWAIVAAVAVTAGAVASMGVAQGRVDPGPLANQSAALNLDTVAIVTGGGTFYTDPAETTIASFGLTGKRPAGFAPGQGGVAQGRINIDQHANLTGRTHVNVPVTYMTAEIASPQTGNQTGGKAQLFGDCTQPQADCGGAPGNTQTVVVYVEDNSDSGAGADKIQITYCSSSPQVVSGGGGSCGLPGLLATLRTGNIQIRTTVTGSGGQAPTAARAPIRLP